MLEEAWVAEFPIALHLRDARIPPVAVVGVVAERGQQRRVNDIKRVADEGHPLRRIQLLTEDGELVGLCVAVAVNTELDARQSLLALRLRVVLILSDEQSTVRCNGDA